MRGDEYFFVEKKIQRPIDDRCVGRLAESQYGLDEDRYADAEEDDDSHHEDQPLDFSSKKVATSASVGAAAQITASVQVRCRRTHPCSGSLKVCPKYR